MGRSRLEQTNHDSQQHRNLNNQERQQYLPPSVIASSVNEKIVIRSLRRRLCNALLREDRDEALRIYTATRSEWEIIVCTEVEIAEAEIERRAKIYEDELKQQKISSCNSISRLMPRKAYSQKGLQQIDTSSEMKLLIEMAQLAPSHQNNSAILKETALEEETAISKWKRNQDEGLLQILMNPTAPFQLDDYKTPYDAYELDLDDQTAASSQCQTDKKEQQGRHFDQRRNDPPPGRQAFSFFNRSNRSSELASPPSIASNNIVIDDDADRIPLDTLPYQNKTDMTTPLHEAARIGSCELIRVMLSSANASRFLLDCNIRNGCDRTILHCVAGGITINEICRYLTRHVNIDDMRHRHSPAGTTVADGIKAPMPLQPTVPESTETNAGHHSEKSSNNKLKNAAVAVGRFVRKTLKHPKDENKVDGRENGVMKENSDEGVVPIAEAEYLHLQFDRIEAAKYILFWSHPDDGSTQAGMGVSSNAVDFQNRTALHYAAALGRTDLSVLICNHFGTMLTIVDSVSQTPCELAGANNWNDLAAQLEACALCYIDPDGTDEELLSTMSDGLHDSNNVASSTPPFYWFETLSSKKVQQKRERRTEQALEKFRQVMKQKQTQTSLNHLLLDDFVTSHSDHVASSNIIGHDALNFMDIKSAVDPQHSVRTPFDFIELLDQSHVERYLTFHSWNLKKALEIFNDDPRAALQKASVPVPILPNHKEETENDVSRVVDDTQNVCLICCETFDASSSTWMNLSGCPHGFCIECLGSYLADCARTKSTGLVVPCPHHECQSLLSRSEIKALSPSIIDVKDISVYSLLEDTANENFVVSDPSFRFCPHPGCGSAVRFIAPSYSKATKLIGTGLLELVGGACTAVCDDAKGQNVETNATLTYEGLRDENYFSVDVQPKRAHRFCFRCGELAIHWPVTCDMLNEWKEVVAKEVKDVANPAGGDDYNDLAQKMWMKANTRPCPKCSVPIQKDEGCNHMTCRNPLCKHEFCWICRNDWKLHSSETGGFFRCNRWVDERDPALDDETIPADATEIGRALVNEDINDPRTMEVTFGTAMFDTRAAKRKSKEMNRFLHHFQRWNAHSESAALERKMGDSACARLASVVAEAIRLNDGDNFIFPGKGLSFIHAAFIELLECRSMLQHSYAMSYFRYKSIDSRRYRLMRRRANEKTTFEQFQAELELMTEHISDIVARSHLRASMIQIMFLTKAAAEKRKEFSNVMINILFEEMQEKENSQGGHDPNQNINPPPSSLAGHTLDTISGPVTFDNLNSTYSSQTDLANVENAVRRSLYQFLARSGTNTAVNFDDDDSEQESDWACHACTYVNNGGRHCAMCQNRRL